MNSGIYLITINNKPYIGFTDNFTERWDNHRSQLQRGKHHSKKLQEAYDTHGDFKVEILLETDGDMAELEKEYIKKYDSKDNGYNMTTGGQGGDTYQFQTPAARAERNKKIGETISRVNTGRKLPKQSIAMMGSKNPSYRSDISDPYLLSLRDSGLSWRQIGKEVGMSHVGAKNRIINHQTRLDK